ncbi:MAG: 50S ribosomal protein L18 [Thermoplasmata archaeon]
MSKGPRYRAPFRRRREGRTDYRKRLGLLRSGRPRAVVRKTLSNTIVQFVIYTPEGDRIVTSAVSKELERYAWKVPRGSVPAAYLTGYLAGKRALEAGLKEAVLDIGLHPPTRGGRVFAALKGVLDAGIQVPHDDDILPEEARIRGDHISKDVVKLFGEVKAKLEAL